MLSARDAVADVVVDASVWISRLVTTDPHHAASARWLAETTATDGLLAAPALVLPEVAGPIARLTGSSRLARRAVSRILRIRGLRIVAIDQELAHGAAPLAADLRLRGADAVYVALASRLRVPLVTLDREQLERGGGVVDVRRPT
jgi:predicted nucleic acid-binding protein